MALTDHLTAVIDPLAPFLESFDVGMCDTNIKKHLSTLNMKEFDTILELISNQKSIIDICPYYSLYKVSIQNGIFSHIIDVFDKSGDDHQITIQYDDNNLVLHIFSIESIVLYTSNIKSRYAFFPISFNAESK